MAKKDSSSKSTTKKVAAAKKGSSTKKVAAENTKDQTRATIRSGGKQHTVAPGNRILIEKLDCEAGAIIDLEQVLAIYPEGDGDALIGTPTVEGAKVSAKVLRHMKAPKLIAFKKKRRQGFKKKIGHRQHLVEVEIESISASR